MLTTSLGVHQHLYDIAQDDGETEVAAAHSATIEVFQRILDGKAPWPRAYPIHMLRQPDVQFRLTSQGDTNDD